MREKRKWVAPKDEREMAGVTTITRKKDPYDIFMESEGIPIYRGIGVHRVQDLPLAKWDRLGGRGSYIQLFGTEGKWGCYLVEVPPGGALNPEKHFFEKQLFVVSGRGTTEVWEEGNPRKLTFEWQAGTLFTIPLNASHRVVNATNKPALLLAGTTAPNIMNLIRNEHFIFNCPYKFRDRFDPEIENYFKENPDFDPDPVLGRAMRKSNVISDLVNCELPLDNVRSPGYRRFEPHMGENSFYQFIGEHQTGRYSKAHAHASAAVLICIKGKGYTYTWPSSLGTTPWQDGKADQVMRQDYEPIGMVTAAPMGGDWFHQHFGCSPEGLRLMAWFGPYTNRSHSKGAPGQKFVYGTGRDIREGGTAIPYDEEDPAIRQEFEENLQKEGLTSQMPEGIYDTPDEFK